MSSIEKAMQRNKAALKETKTTSVQAAVENELKADNELKNKNTPPKINETAAEKSAASPVEQTPEKKSAPNKPLGAGIAPEDLTPKQPNKQPYEERKSLHIDLERLEREGFVTLLEKRSLINEEYRSIKRKLLNNAFGAISKTLKHSNLILVSSSKPNEGKTFTAVNLALSIALEQDKTVLLVDSDVLKPSVAKTLDIGKNVGLIEYLLGEEKDVQNIMYHTNIDRLRVIPAGLPHHLSNELLSSDKMIKLIEEFATRYPDRIVVFDAPPLLGVNETAIMAEQCGQGVVVVEEHKSKISDVQKAVSLLPAEMAVGFVLNKVTSNNENQGYGYYYGSGDENTGSKRA